MKEKIVAKLKDNLKKDRLQLAVRIILGVILSILIAYILKIDFASSTGVITLLTIDQTKRATFEKTFLRIISFLYTYLISWFAVDFLKLDPTLSFAISITLVTLLTFLLRWDSTLSVNCVILIQLFLNSKPFNFNLFLNETGRLLVGVLTALFINWIFNVRFDDTEASGD